MSADGDVRQIINALLPTLAAGTIIVDTSTVSAGTAREMAHRLPPKAQFLDAPISGGVEGAKNAVLAMMVRGDAAALGKTQPVLRAIAQRIVHMEPSAAAKPPRR